MLPFDNLFPISSPTRTNNYISILQKKTLVGLELVADIQLRNFSMSYGIFCALAFFCEWIIDLLDDYELLNFEWSNLSLLTIENNSLPRE